MRRCDLRGPYARAEDVYVDLARQLGLPGHFGGNLDALWDALVRDVPGPIEIRWPGFEAARAALGADADRIRTTIEEASAERDDLVVSIG